MPSKTPAPSDELDPKELDRVDELAADVAAETADYPEGCPEFIPVLALPRMRRADAYEALGQIQAQQRQVKSVEPDSSEDEDATPADAGDEAAEVKPVEIDPASYGAQYRVIAYIEQYLGVVALSPKAFAEWAANVSDTDLVRAFNVYIRKTQPGEAESSTG